MYGKFDNIEIKGISTVVPSTVEYNTIYAPVMGERRNKKQIKLTGVNKRHISAQNQTASDLCYGAATYLLDDLKWNTKDIKVMIFITQGPNYRLPSTAFLLHKRLGLPKDCLVYDINLGCSSFNVGIQTICALMQTCELGEKGLLLVGDTASKIKSPHRSYKNDEIAHDMLFGAEGSCIALEKVEHNDIYFTNLSDGNGYQAIKGEINEPTKMDGSAVFSFAIDEVSKTVNEFINTVGIDRNNTFFVFHQAQKLILDNLIDSCDINPENELRSLEEYGNTSGGSVPLTLCANKGKIKEANIDSFLLCGFGVGLSWGCIYTQLPLDHILPIIEYDECFEQRPMYIKKLTDKTIAVFGTNNDLGEWITKYLYDLNPNLVLSDSDNRFSNDTNQFGDKSRIIVRANDEWTKENLDGLVFISDVTEEQLMFACKHLKSIKENESDAAPCRIVIVYDRNRIGQDLTVPQIMEMTKPYSDYVTVNLVEYDSAGVRIFKICDLGQSWVENYIKEGSPDDLVKASYIAINVAHLLSDSAKYLNGSIIKIS